jgi:hypothetical protein
LPARTSAVSRSCQRATRSSRSSSSRRSGAQRPPTGSRFPTLCASSWGGGSNGSRPRHSTSCSPRRQRRGPRRG